MTWLTSRMVEYRLHFNEPAEPAMLVQLVLDPPWLTWHDMCQCCHRYQIAIHATALYGCTAVPVIKVKLWNQQHVLFCSLTIKEMNFVLILVVHSLQFSEVAAATTNMTDLSRHEYDWRLRLSHINMTDSDLTKYDWRRRLGDGGSRD